MKYALASNAPSLPPLAHDPEDALRRLFGFDAFRPGQREAIDLVVDGHDGLIVMPTGAGKSLCFQLPALIREGVTLVVSPLIALMKDQVDSLRELDLPATFINSTITDAEKTTRQNGIVAGDYKIVYVAPERFKSRTFLGAVARAPVSLMIVDEAHCVSQWGHDFRPDYLRLAAARRSVGDPQIVGLTATATRAVRRDIVSQLEMRDPQILVSGFERPNLHFEVRSTETEADKVDALTGIVERHRGSSIIVYCATRKQVESVATTLDEEGIGAAMYHAGLKLRSRAATQEAWMTDEVDVLVATNAFGMGVDKPDVRAIVHWNIPASLEAYYQEAGRAGRDGEPASCVVLFGFGDRRIRDFFNENTYPPRHKIERVWEFLLRDGSPYVYLDLDETARELGPPGDRLHPMGFRTALRLLRRQGHVSRYSTSDGTTEVVLGDRSSIDELRIDWKYHLERREIVTRQLEEMLEFVKTGRCLQRHLVRHFDATPSFDENCGHCANCVPFAPSTRGDSDEVSEATTRLVRILLSGVARMAGEWGVTNVAAVLAGSKRNRLRSQGLDRLSVYGLLEGEHTQREIRAMLDALIDASMVQRVSYGCLELTRHGAAVMTARAPVWPQVAQAVESSLADRSPTAA